MVTERSSTETSRSSLPTPGDLRLHQHLALAVDDVDARPLKLEREEVAEGRLLPPPRPEPAPRDEVLEHAV
jgi:hypothetical protein